MRWFTILKRKTKPCSAGLILSKSALEITQSPMAGHGAERRGKGPSHLTPAHGTRSYWPWECCCSSHAPSQQPLASGRQQTASGAKGVPPGKLQPAFTELQHFLHYFPRRASCKWHTTCIQREKISFCHQKAVEKFPASYLQAHASWTLICPQSLCGGSNTSPARQWPATGTWFFETPFWEDETGLCCSPLCVHYCHISEVTQNKKHLGWEQPKAILQHLLKKRVKVALRDLTTKPQYIQTVC